MPYVPEYSRQGSYENVGELTFMLTAMVLSYLDDDPTYQEYAEVLGALEATKLELYRRSIAPYENQKAIENGDLPYPHGDES